MKNMDFDKLVEDHLSKKYPHPISDNDVYFENGFRAGAKWAKDLLSSKLKEDHISPEDRRMIYDFVGKLLIESSKKRLITEEEAESCITSAFTLYNIINEKS